MTDASNVGDSHIDAPYLSSPGSQTVNVWKKDSAQPEVASNTGQ